MSGAPIAESLSPGERQLLINQALWVLIHKNGGELVIPLEEINGALIHHKMGSIHLSAQGENIHLKCLDVETHEALVEKHYRGLVS